jgi:FkbM family methyltransferase
MKTGICDMEFNKLRLFLRNHKILKTVAYPARLLRRFLISRKTNCQKRLYHNLQQILVEDPVIYVEEFQARFQIDPRSDLFSRILFNQSYEPSLAGYCKRLINPKKDAIDVGANVGFYTVYFTKLIERDRRVLSVEPTKNALCRLYKNLEINEISNKVIVFEGAASNNSGYVKISTREGKEEYSSIGKMMHLSGSEQDYSFYDVKTITIDELVNENKLNPGFIKIDVEGAENLVLEGCQQTLKNYKPVILSELSNIMLERNDSSSKEVIQYIKSFGYDVIDPEYPTSPVKPEYCSEILCIHPENNTLKKC